MAEKIRWGVLGGGGDSLIGGVHRIASQMHDCYQLVGGCTNPDWEANIGFAREIGIPTDRIYKDLDTMVEEELKLPEDKRMQVVSIMTPNFLHYPMAKKLIESGFNVICEKPLTMTHEEAVDLQNTISGTGLIFAVTYTYTGYPMIRQMRHMITSGEIGELQRVDMQYYQGWINPFLHDKSQRSTIWRLDPEKSGISCCVGDIGTHAFDMLEYVTGEHVQEILADLNYVYDDNRMDVDGTIMVRMPGKAKGVIRVSQIATGEENNFTVAIYGRHGGLKWEQQNPNYLTYLTETDHMKVIKPGHPFNSDAAKDAAKLPPGHPEGMIDSMGNIYHGVARAVRGEDYQLSDFPQLDEGVRGMHFIEKAVESHEGGNVWVKL